jgi:hypothetical protein
LKKFYTMFFVMFVFFVVIGQFSFGLEIAPLSTLPPFQAAPTPIPVQTAAPTRTPIPFQTLVPEGTPMHFYTPAPTPAPTPIPTQTPEIVPPDIFIINVVREFQWTGTTGTYYRYYIWLGRTGGDMSALSVRVSIFTGFAYSDHGEQSTSLVYTEFPAGSTGCCVTELINIRPLSHGEYPSSYVIGFNAHSDDQIAESDEGNNSWTCDSVIDECATCIGPDECYP